jgi:hypothetical protein
MKACPMYSMTDWNDTLNGFKNKVITWDTNKIVNEASLMQDSIMHYSQRDERNTVSGFTQLVYACNAYTVLITELESRGVTP